MSRQAKLTLELAKKAILRTTQPMKLELATAVTIEMAQGADGQPGRPTANVNAYNGGPVRVSGWRHPVVVDLESLNTPRTIPLLRSHDAERIVGHGSPIVTPPNRLDIAGTISASTADAEQVVNLAQGGFPWQASVGVDVQGKPQFLAEGESAVVNGQRVNGPAYVVRGGELYEVSFVTLGADRSTSAAVAAEFVEGETKMENQEPEKIEAGADVQAVFERAKLEQNRQKAIAVIAQRAMDEGRDILTVEAATRKAIEGGNSPDQFELSLMRDLRPLGRVSASKPQVNEEAWQWATVLMLRSITEPRCWKQPERILSRV
jgi:hypothetical protein